MGANLTKRMRRLRDELARAQGGLCFWCGREMAPSTWNVGASLSLDHVIPRADGGSNRKDNLVAACKRCNSARPSRASQRHNEQAQRDALARKNEGPSR